jgi:acetolactate synthase-1/3 small subunit
MEEKIHIISLLVNNKPDVLARVSGTLGGRGYNIESLCVNVTANPEMSRIVLTTTGDKPTITKIKKQLDKLIDVHQVSDLTEVNSVQRELVLIRMKVTEENKSKITETIDTFKFRVIIMEPDYCILEVTGTPGKMENALAHLKPMGIEDIARTGTIALKRKE